MGAFIIIRRLVLGLCLILIMMNKGQIIHDFRGEEKRRLRANDLLALFDEVRRKEQIDHTTAEMLSQAYV